MGESRAQLDRSGEGAGQVLEKNFFYGVTHE